MADGVSVQPWRPDRVRPGMAVAATLDLDAALMLRVRDGCSSSYAALLERHRNPVIHYVFRMVQNQAIAEELAQEVFLRVYRSRQKYEPSAKFTTWLFRIATNLAFNWLRDERSRKSQESLNDGLTAGATINLKDRRPSVESVLVHNVKLNAVREAIGSLPEKQRAAVLMHKYEEMEYSQIAKVLGCSDSAVKSLIFRAYESLREKLAQYG